MVTIFTPTYNRATTINRTYESLIKQTCKDFEWLIVDDGSTDNTESLIQSWISESIIEIRYLKQSNSGKYRAYNNGLRNAKGDFFICVDSDDWLPVNAVDNILAHSTRLHNDDSLAGFVALKGDKNNNLIGAPFKHINITRSLYSLELNGEGGERTIVFKTEIARQFLFPEETDEKFLGESVIYDRYHGKYEFLVTNDVLTICEYQSDGLSSNPKNLMLQNPAGYKLYFAQRIDMATNIYSMLSYTLRYHAFRLLYKGQEYNYNGRYSFIVSVLAPLGFVVKCFYRRYK